MWQGDRPDSFVLSYKKDGDLASPSFSNSIDNILRPQPRQRVQDLPCAGLGHLAAGLLGVGADVMINGIKIGTVIGLKLDNENYDAEIKLSIAPDVKLPEDSVATIATNGLMGNKFIKIEPGKSKEILKNGDEITNTKDFKTLEDMVGEVIFMVTGDDDKE